ncbi:MAG: hypothetical protein JW855_00225 [Gammaproteobacteria bacterium]|nr:hypothetical protein [Gammaproteobacteria bacterium]
MRTSLSIIFTLLLSIAFFSCFKEDGFEELQNEKHRVKFKVYADDPKAKVYLPNYYGIMTTFNGEWEDEYVTKDFFCYITAECMDENVCITIEAYLDGKFKEKRMGHRLVMSGFRLKGQEK